MGLDITPEQFELVEKVIGPVGAITWLTVGLVVALRELCDKADEANGLVHPEDVRALIEEWRAAL